MYVSCDRRLGRQWPIGQNEHLGLIVIILHFLHVGFIPLCNSSTAIPVRQIKSYLSVILAKMFHTTKLHPHVRAFSFYLIYLAQFGDKL